MKDTFTLQYFFGEIRNFRKLMGNKESMANYEKMDLALKALTYVYLNVKAENEDEKEQLEATMQAITNEFQIRCNFA